MATSIAHSHSHANDPGRPRPIASDLNASNDSTNAETVTTSADQ